MRPRHSGGICANVTDASQHDSNKCKVMHVGHRNERAIYNMSNHRLEEVEEDLGVLIHRTLSVGNNCAVAVKKANQMARHIYRTLTQKSIQTVVPLYKALARPHLEYCSLVRSLYLKKDILSIANVQRRVTKMIPSISALTYEERSGLISLENRRLREDLLEVFKILKGFVKVDPATHFSMRDRRSRGHTLKLEKPRARLELRKHFFSNRVIDAWNALPGHTVEATSVNLFKAALQRLPHGVFTSWRQLPAPRSWPSDNLNDGLTDKYICPQKATYNIRILLLASIVLFRFHRSDLCWRKHPQHSPCGFL